ncbi:MAG: TSUP family transporter [Actinobacteria bacterium]|nr:TSUP family transporter [Actinomycetota bacterium]
MIAAAIAVAAGAVAQAISGLGFALVAGPLLIATLGRAEGVRLTVLLGTALNVMLLVGDHRRANWRIAALLLVPAALATPLFKTAFSHVEGRSLAVAAGVLTIVSAAVLASGARSRHAAGRVGAAVTGVISSAMTVLAGIGGPPIAMFAVNAEWPAETIRPTLQVYFLGLNIVALAVLGLPELTLAPWLGLVGGWILGIVVSRRLPPGVARPAILAIAVIGGVIAVLRAHP